MAISEHLLADCASFIM